MQSEGEALVKTNFDKLYQNVLVKVQEAFDEFESAGKTLSRVFEGMSPFDDEKKFAFKIEEELRLFLVNLEVYGSFGNSYNRNGDK